LSGVNLLYVIEGGRNFGGAEQVLLTTLGAIDKTQYKIFVCLLIPSAILEEKLRDLGVSFFILDMASKWDIFSVIRLSRFMRKEKIGIVHCLLYASHTFGRIAAILARVPVILAWEEGEIFGQVPIRHIWVDRILSRFTDGIVSCSDAAKEEIIRKEAIPEYKIRVIRNAVDLDKFNTSRDTATIRSQLGIGKDEILIGTVASLSNKIKGQEYLIRAMPQIINVYPQTKLLLVGEGPSRADFLQITETLNISDKVIFTGFRKDIPDIMNALDIYVCSSILEGLGLSILEAMSFKKPVIATRVGGTPELVIHGQTGFLVPSKDANSLAQATIKLLADRGKMQQMGRLGFERVRAVFSVNSFIKEMESLYKEFLWKIHP